VVVTIKAAIIEEMCKTYTTVFQVMLAVLVLKLARKVSATTSSTSRFIAHHPLELARLFIVKTFGADQ
jgi:hypothetical protein